MDNEWANKTALEILDDLKSMVLSIRPKPIDQFDTISYLISPEQWERLMYYGWWPDMPPALDMWRFGLTPPAP